MRVLFIVALIVTNCLIGFAQSEFAPIGAKWYFNQSSSINSDYVYFESVKDTVVQNKSCRTIEVKLNGFKLVSREYLRQTNDSIFYFNTNSNSFHLLYNFSAKVGDTITVHKGKFKPTKAFFSYNDSIPGFRYKIVSIDSIQVSGNWVKRQKVVSFKDDLWGVSKPNGNEYYILDKVGSLAYFFGVQAGITPEDNLSLCRCYSDSRLAFRNPLWDYDCGISEKLVVDVGKDTTYCTEVGKMYLGDKMIIKNGVEPYSIKWECRVPKGLYSYFTASDLLSDTTAISPFFTYTPSNNQWIKFTIHVTDAKNNYAADSIRVRFSKFGYLTGYAGIEIKKGDSILFKDSSVGGGIEPFEYQWQPKTGLSNPDSLVTWCKPNSTTLYDIIVTDSCGCVSYPNTVYYVMVLPTALNEVKNDKDNLLNIRQNGKLIYFNNPYKQEARITLCSINGEAIYNLTITEDHFEIGDLLKIKGLYIVKISLGEHTGSSKFIYL